MDDSAAVADLRRAVSRVIRRHLRAGSEARELPDDVELAELGLDSVGSIELLLDLESTFGVVFPDEVITAENFGSAGRITRTLACLVPAT